jgi:thiamine-monophosphate kinase
VGARASDLGEFGLIERLLARLGASGEGVVVGPGDDAAAVRVGSETVLATADLLLEGVHFEIGLSSPADVGWKALAVNLSDVAAMGGAPRFALVSLGAPAATPSATLEEIYGGLDECARAFGVAVVGGDTVRSDRLIVSVAVVGSPGESGIVTRSGALPGEGVCVTGTVGGAAAGLALLRDASNDEQAAALLEKYPSLATAHRRPSPRIREGLAAARAGATAMIDLSDGLGRDVGHICDASGAGVRLNAGSVRLTDGVAETAAWAGVDPLSFALGGGDDYELVMAIPADRSEELRRAFGPTPSSVIGEFTAGPDAVLDRGDGLVEPLSKLGWDHFEEGA